MIRFRSVRVLLAAAAAFGALALASAGAQAAPVTHKCGAPTRSIVKTEEVQFNTNATDFVAVPGATVRVKVPAGETQCVKVRLTAVANCGENAAVADVCTLRVIEPGGQALDPANPVNFVVEDGTAAAHAFSWVKELPAGAHRIELQAAVQNPATTFRLFTWTLEVEQTQ